MMAKKPIGGYSCAPILEALEDRVLLAADPVAGINLFDTSAGLTAGESIHVDALATKLNAGDWLNGQFSWDFGDPGSRYNTMPGWNAGHIYEKPGT